jgi:protease-4
MNAVRRSVAVLSLVLVTPGCVFVSGNLDPFSRRPQPLEERVVQGRGEAKILVLDVSRVISAEAEEDAFGIRKRESVVARVEAELQRAADDEDLAALVLRINSPGGTVTASDIVYQRLVQFKAERRIPVLAQLMDVAASGGYYVALAADEIAAHPTTVTGSVGVVFYTVSLEGLLEKIGVRDQTVKTGTKKDLGSPLRTMTAEERALLEGVLGEMQARFLGLVRERRRLGPEAERTIADGRIVSAGQAQALGLVDRIGYLEETIARARALAGVSEARVVMYRRPDEFSEDVYSQTGLRAPVVNLVNFDLGGAFRAPQFLYLWMPSAP